MTDWLIYAVYFGLALLFSRSLSRQLPERLTRAGFLDKKSLPDKKPTAGGVAVALPFLLLVGVTAATNWVVFGVPPHKLAALLTGAGIILLLGLADDRYGLPAWVKLAVQLVAALALLYGGIQMGAMTNPFADPFNPGVWGNVILVVWILAITNAVNLIDGIDGLAAGITLVSSVTLFVIAHIFGEFGLALMTATLAGAVFGFIRFNLPPAKMYLGDTGSLFLGFVLAAVSVIERRKGSATITLLLPLVVLAVPVADTVFAFIRRTLKGQSPLKGDTLHIHHRLLRLGLSEAQAVRFLILFSVYLGFFAGALAFLSKEATVVILALLAAGILLGFEFLLSLERDREEEQADQD